MAAAETLLSPGGVCGVRVCPASAPAASQPGPASYVQAPGMINGRCQGPQEDRGLNNSPLCISVFPRGPLRSGEMREVVFTILALVSDRLNVQMWLSIFLTFDVLLC